MRSRWLSWWGLLFIAASSRAAAGQPVQAIEETRGYRIGRNQVVVEGDDHWQDWKAGDGVRVIEDDGAVRPRFMRRGINAVLNAGEFTNIAGEDTTGGGISAVGTPGSEETAPLILDGDMSTYWEPDLDKDLDALWVEIDLGRAVIAQRIVIRFVEEGQGDPFLKFRVLISDGSKLFGLHKEREFAQVGRVSRRNKEQREFSFEIEPLRPTPDGVVGEVVQFVRIDLLATDGPRGAEVDQVRYRLLPPAERGVIDYFRRTVKGREIPVVKESYDLLLSAERGPVRYYRRERPRLAEVEVHALGDNIVTLTQRTLFEQGDFFEGIARRFMTDGLFSTRFGIRVYNHLRNEEQVAIDLGAKFWLDRIRLLSNSNPPTSYQLRVSDGSLAATGDYLWHVFEERLNPELFLQLEERFPPREVRLIELRRLDLFKGDTRGGVLNEIQAYGEGYVSELSMESPIIQLKQRWMFTGVNWEGSTPPGTRLEIRTRSGDERIQIPHYMRSDGREVREALYVRLPDADRGPIVIEELPGDGWSSWSELYRTSGELFKSPTPRRMAIVQVRLRSSEPLRFASIRRLSLDLAPPLVDKIVGEIGPLRHVRPGVNEEFTLYIRPFVKAQDPGFDRLLLSSSSSAPVELLALRAGTDVQLRFGQAVQLWPGSVLAEERGDGSVELIFPEPVRQREQVLELSFRTRVFLPSTTFRIEMRHQQQPDVVQVVDPGDASANLKSNSLVVVSELRDVPLLGKLEVRPRVFTPNGDDINDLLSITLEVFQVEGERRIRFGIYDLSGRLLRDLSFKRQRPSGEHRVWWDGRDDRGALLSPGIYLVQVELPIDARDRKTRIVRPVHLVY